MKLELLQILECPFCGGRLRAEKASTEVSAGEITTGILLCECSAYPVLAGIPFMRTGRDAERAMVLIGSGERERALGVLLGLDENDAITLRTLLSPTVTFREALALLDRSAEVVYLLYRFSDPTFIASEAVLLALTQDPRCRANHILDIGGGTGHLTRSLCRSEPTGKVILADVAFWKVFLAKMFIAPACQPVCCDANHPLPFARESFSLVNCSDAFHYIWSKRQLAAEMQRLIGLTGVITVPHLHNALSWNPSQGNPLSPEGYATLFHRNDVGLFEETPVRQAALHDLPIDLSLKRPSVELQSAPALLLIATALDGVFVSHQPPQENSGQRLQLNPLYAPDHGSPGNVWIRKFPSADYEEEYAACKDYLPERIELSPQQIEGLQSGRCDVNLQSLARRRVLLDLPDRYV